MNDIDYFGELGQCVDCGEECDPDQEYCIECRPRALDEGGDTASGCAWGLLLLLRSFAG